MMKTYLARMSAFIGLILLFFGTPKIYHNLLEEINLMINCEKCPFTFDASFDDDKIKKKAPGGVNGGWNYNVKLIETAHVAFDDGFARNIVQLVTRRTPGKGISTPVTIGDIGAGVGQFGAWLRDHQVRNISWHGFDGGNNVESFAGTTVNLKRGGQGFLIPKVCWLDASSDVGPYSSQMCNAPYDWVISVEVGEHIPVERMDTFVNNLIKLSREGVILTWAVRGQGGYNHVNNRDNTEIIQVMAGKGMVYLEGISKQMRKEVSGLSWLRNTIMVFAKTG